MELDQRFRGCLLGLATGDAVGTAVEFSPRGSFPPVDDMVGGGPFQLQAGQWTDDTSMALCLAASLIACNGFDARDQMDRYTKWYREGYMSSTGRCFDIGNTTSAALERYQRTGEPFSGTVDPRSAGNGSIMRLAAVPLFYYPDEAQARHYAGKSSQTTHGAVTCVEACKLLSGILVRVLRGDSKDVALREETPSRFTSEEIQRIAQGSYRTKAAADIRGTGYVVSSLEAALWCFWTTESFEQAILAAVNLGDDADTTAAICGQVAGAFYGEVGIPAKWLDKLAMRADIVRMADQLNHGRGK